MSIKTTLFAIAFALVAVTAQAQTTPPTINCAMDYTDGSPVGKDDGTVYYPDGTLLRTADGELLYPNGTKLLALDGTMTYTDGTLLKSPDGAVKYYGGAKLREADGSTFLSDGSAYPLIRYEIPYDDNVSVILRAWKRGSTYKLHAKGQNAELVVSIDTSLNILCEFVKPIGPTK